MSNKVANDYKKEKVNAYQKEVKANREIYIHFKFQLQKVQKIK